jgi:hypothetical protein
MSISDIVVSMGQGNLSLVALSRRAKAYATFLVEVDRIDLACVYLDRVQKTDIGDSLAAYLLKYLMEECRASQRLQVMNLLEEHYIPQESPSGLFLMRQLLWTAEGMMNRCGDSIEQFNARRRAREFDQRFGEQIADLANYV